MPDRGRTDDHASKPDIIVKSINCTPGARLVIRIWAINKYNNVFYIRHNFKTLIIVFISSVINIMTWNMGISQRLCYNLQQ